MRYVSILALIFLACLTLGPWETLAYGFTLAPFAFFWAGCTCCPGCDIATDDFSTDTIANYDQRSGSWSVSGGKLVPPTSGLLVGNTAAAAQGIKFSASFNFASATGSARWIVDYVDDSNYHFAEVVCTGATSATLQIFKRVAAANTAISPPRTLTGFSWSTDVTIAICFSSTSFTAVLDATRWRMATVDDHGGLKAGVATVSVSSSARFDDWSFTILGETCSTCTITAGCYGSVVDADFSIASGTVAANFNVVSGVWTDSNTAFCTGSGHMTSASADAVVVYNTDVDNATGSVGTSWQLTSTVGHKARSIGAYVDSSNYLFAELEVTATTGGGSDYDVKLYERRGGSNTLLASTSKTDALVGNCFTLTICWTGETAKATLTGLKGGSVSADSDMVGYKVGAGTSGGGMRCYLFDYTCGFTC